MEKNQVMELLRSEFIFWSRLGFGFDPPVTDEKGAALLYEDITQHIEYHRQMYDAGVKIHTCSLNNGWIGIDTYNYDTIDRMLEDLFRVCPDIYLIPRIKLNPPYEWQKAHPADLYIYENADFASNDEIAACVGTDVQDTTGARDGNRKMGHQSFSSQKWREDAAEALRRVIKHIEGAWYAEKIIAYHIAYGKCGETHFWGDSADFGMSNKKAFYEFALKKYGDITLLERNWKKKNVTIENVPLPSNDMRYHKNTCLHDFFHMGEEYKIYVDYNLYRKQLSCDTLNYFCKIAKEQSGKAIGVFHGYLMHAGADYCGHTDIGEILNSEYIDFLAAPKSYYRNEFGEPGGSYCVPLSVNRKKLWIEELDNRTHLSSERALGVTNDSRETLWVMWREFARNEMNDNGYWWMDLGGGWYNDKELLNELSKLYTLKKQLSTKKHESVAQVLIVLDEKNMLWTTQNYNFCIRTLQDTTYEVAMIGTIYDMYRMEDLTEINLSQYRLVIFLNAFALGYEEFQKIKFSEDTYFIWNYAPGYIKGDTEKLTGMKIREMGQHEEFPYLEIQLEEDLQIMETYDELPMEYEKIPVLKKMPKQGIKTARKGRNVLCTLPSLKRNRIREIAELAGCHMYAPLNTIVYGDNRFIARFTEENFTFEMMEE